MLSRVAYGGWPDNVRLTNGTIELITTLTVGPRVIRFAFIDGANVMKEYAGQLGGTRETEWQIRGGHRLWHAPEVKPRTYALDNSPVALEEVGEFGFIARPNPETENGIQKEIEVLMDPAENRVTLFHRITNIAPWDIELSPWTPTVMDAGGISIVPLPAKRSHTEVVLPELPLVLWPYTDMADPRLSWGTRYITFSQDTQKPPNKFGLANKDGWAAYLVHGTLFVKYFDYDPSEVYPDMGCNYETFSNEEMLEVESMGPLTLLGPGETVEHVETWRIFADVPLITDEASIDRIIRPLVES